jgi:hypothetical protein
MQSPNSLEKKNIWSIVPSVKRSLHGMQYKHSWTYSRFLIKSYDIRQLRLRYRSAFRSAAESPFSFRPRGLLECIREAQEVGLGVRRAEKGDTERLAWRAIAHWSGWGRDDARRLEPEGNYGAV